MYLHQESNQVCICDLAALHCIQRIDSRVVQRQLVHAKHNVAKVELRQQQQQRQHSKAKKRSGGAGGQTMTEPDG